RFLRRADPRVAPRARRRPERDHLGQPRARRRAPSRRTRPTRAHAEVVRGTPVPRPDPDRARLLALREGTAVRDGDAGIAHRNARADREPDLGPALPRRASVALRDRGSGHRARRDRLAHAGRRAGNRVAGSRLSYRIANATIAYW